MGPKKHRQINTRFRCNDCKVTFARASSLIAHKNFYCVKRRKIPVSSTVTSNEIVDSFQNSAALVSGIPAAPSQAFAELSRTRVNNEDGILNQVKHRMDVAAAEKRRTLEEALKVAQETLSVVMYHRSAHDQLTRALVRLKSLSEEFSSRPAVSPVENPSAVLAEAQSRVNDAFQDEKRRSALVARYMFLEKKALQTAVAADAEERAALIATLDFLRKEYCSGVAASQTQPAGFIKAHSVLLPTQYATLTQPADFFNANLAFPSKQNATQTQPFFKANLAFVPIQNATVAVDQNKELQEVDDLESSSHWYKLRPGLQLPSIQKKTDCSVLTEASHQSQMDSFANVLRQKISELSELKERMRRDISQKSDEPNTTITFNCSEPSKDSFSAENSKESRSTSVSESESELKMYFKEEINSTEE